MSSPRVVVVLVFCVLATACLDETRLNARCDWVGDTSTVAIDMRNGAQRHHLAMDVRVAGENAVRYGDSAKATHGIVRNAPPPGERWTMWVHLVWVGLMGSLIAAAVAHFHGWNVDWVRLRNGHISFRAAYLPIALYRWQAYGVALAIFAFATWRQFRRAGVASGAPRDRVNRWGQ